MKYFNPNPAGKVVGDCVIRAIAKATGDSWGKVYMDLAATGHELSDMPSSNAVWGAYLRRRGFARSALPDYDGYTVRQFAAELSRANQQSALMAQLFQMQMQSQECCCENRAAVAQVRYDMATQGCETRNTVQNAARDIIDNANGNSKAILDFLVQSKMRDLESENQSLKLAASQAAQNSYLVSALRPSPIPAYQVANPYCCNYGCGCSA